MEDHESVSANGKNIEDIRIKPDLEDVSEDDFEEAYDLLKKSIDRKRQTQRKEFNGSMCKICGKKLTSNAQLQECKLCNISTCKNCRSCGFCLNCFVHMKEDYRKTLKLTRILAITMPGLLLFLMIYGFLYYISVTSLLVVLFWSFYFYTKRKTANDPERSLEYNWEKKIRSQDYERFKNPKYPYRFVKEDLTREKKVENERRVAKLRRWAEEEPEDLPPTPLLHRDKSCLEGLIGQDISQVEEICEILDYNENIFTMEECPNCGGKIEISNFCPACERKFCPECEEELRTHSKRCMCGFSFPPIEMQFLAYIKGKKNPKYNVQDREKYKNDPETTQNED